MSAVILMVAIVIMVSSSVASLIGGAWWTKSGSSGNVCADLINPMNANDLNDGRWEKYNCQQDATWRGINGVCDQGDCNSLGSQAQRNRCFNNRFLCQLMVKDP